MDIAINFVLTHPFTCWATVFGVLALRKLIKGRGRRGHTIKDLHDSEKVALTSGFRWRPINLKVLPKVDHGFYQQATSEFAALGYRPLGDFEYLHWTEAHPNRRTGVRQFVCDHGQIYASVYHMPVQGWMGWVSLLITGTRQSRVIHFETVLVDGRFIITMNGCKSSGLSNPVQLLKYCYPEEMSVADLLKMHVANVNNLLVGDPLPAPIVVTTLDGIMELKEKQLELQSNYRDNGGVSAADDLRRIQLNLSEQEGESSVTEARQLAKG